MTRQRRSNFQRSLPKTACASRRHQAGGSPADAFARNHRRFHRQCRPGAELPMVLQVLDGAVVVRGPGPTRTLPHPISRTPRPPASLLMKFWSRCALPVMPAGAGFTIEEFARRHGDFAIAAVTAVILREGRGCARPHRHGRHISHSERLRAAGDPRAAMGWAKMPWLSRRRPGRMDRFGPSAGLRGVSAAGDAGPDRARGTAARRGGMRQTMS